MKKMEIMPKHHYYYYRKIVYFLLLILEDLGKLFQGVPSQKNGAQNRYTVVHDLFSKQNAITFVPLRILNSI